MKKIITNENYTIIMKAITISFCSLFERLLFYLLFLFIDHIYHTIIRNKRGDLFITYLLSIKVLIINTRVKRKEIILPAESIGQSGDTFVTITLESDIPVVIS